MKARRTWPVSALLGAAVLCAMTNVLLAQEGPMVLGRHEKPPVLTLDPFHGSVDLMSIMEYDNSKTNGQNTKSTDVLFQESLSLSTGGGIVTKNFIDWHAAITLGLIQEFANLPSESRNSNGILQAYDLETTVLRTSDFPVSLYARRTEDYIYRSYSSVLQSTTTDYGGTVSYRSPTIPTTLSVSRTEINQEDLSGGGQYHLEDDRIALDSQWQPTDRQDVTLSYEFNNIGQSGQGIFGDNYSTQNLSATHQWAFDDYAKSALMQSLNYNQQSGQFPFTHLRLNELLRIQATETLETNLNYTYDQQEYSSVVSQSNQLSGGFTHHLFESLTTTGQAGGSLTNSSFSEGGSSSNDGWFANLNFDYRKKVALGDLDLNAFVGYVVSDNGETENNQVLNQVETFNDPVPIILTQPGINSSSIAVFDAAGVRRYTEGTDYTVSTFGNTVQIRRVVGGLINSGQTVRVDYNLLPLPAYNTDTSNVGLGFRYDFTESFLKGLGVYGRYSQQNQTISSTAPTGIIPDDIRDTILGADYRVWKLTFLAEGEVRDSTLAPQNALRFGAHYSDRLDALTPVSLNFTQAFLRYPEQGTQPGGETNYTTIDARLEREINRQLKGIITVRWQNDEDSRYGNTMGIEEDAELRWHVRQTDFHMRLRHTNLQASGSDSETLILQLGLTRNF